MDERTFVWVIVALLALTRFASRQSSGSMAPLDTKENDEKRWLWQQFFAAQNELVSQTRSVEAQDAALGVTIAVAGTFGFWMLDHMKTASGSVPPQHIASACVAALATAFAVFGWVSSVAKKVKIRVLEESLEINEIKSLHESIAETAKLTAMRRQSEQLKRLAQTIAVAWLILAALLFASPWW